MTFAGLILTLQAILTIHCSWMTLFVDSSYTVTFLSPLLGHDPLLFPCLASCAPVAEAVGLSLPDLPAQLRLCRLSCPLSQALWSHWSYLVCPCMCSQTGLVFSYHYLGEFFVVPVYGAWYLDSMSFFLDYSIIIGKFSTQNEGVINFPLARETLHGRHSVWERPLNPWPCAYKASALPLSYSPSERLFISENSLDFSTHTWLSVWLCVKF